MLMLTDSQMEFIKKLEHAVCNDKALIVKTENMEITISYLGKFTYSVLFKINEKNGVDIAYKKMSIEELMSLVP